MSVCPHGNVSWVSPPCEKCEEEIRMPDNTRFLIIEIEIGEKLSWKSLERHIQGAINLVQGALFMGIRVAGSPDPYLLDDPDNPPEDWK